MIHANWQHISVILGLNFIKRKRSETIFSQCGTAFVGNAFPNLLVPTKGGSSAVVTAVARFDQTAFPEISEDVRTSAIIGLGEPLHALQQILL